VADENSRNRSSPASPTGFLSAAIARCNKWWEDTVHTLVVMHDWKQQKKLEAAIRDLVWLAVERARRGGYEQGLAHGKRRAVN